MINIYLVIILCALLLANTGFFCEHHGATTPGQTTVTANQQTSTVLQPIEKNKLAKLESRLEQLSQELTGVIKTVNKLSKTLARHSQKLQNSPGNQANKPLRLTTTSFHADKVISAPAKGGFITPPAEHLLKKADPR
ncbi:hypothetical protein [Thalassomonas actiniarum]|uniref:Uncharacterized protein n=1 Tax=Thalassomonas actiniarum TaxID=485447 RepID=A0AAE9YP05_9GAMM|nr:hypothetical protein [Thalassomonas actiniarum]WDD96962.1 hypothetical protein SG35_016535 [Thalassomonas actiniarum]